MLPHQQLLQLLDPMRWNNALSRFVIRKMAQLVSDGSRPDKVFKDKM